MDKYKQKLIEEKTLLLSELSNIGKINDETGKWDAIPEVELINQDVSDLGDTAERANDYEERSSLLLVLEKRLNDIDDALLKIDTNLFGICEECKEKIEEDRLNANPSSKNCKVCMSD